LLLKQSIARIAFDAVLLCTGEREGEGKTGRSENSNASSSSLSIAVGGSTEFSTLDRFRGFSVPCKLLLEQRATALKRNGASVFDEHERTRIQGLPRTGERALDWRRLIESARRR